jgi:hypothetical protein
MCYCDFEPADAYRETDRRARKEHRCYECSSVIRRGETYRYMSGVWDGCPGSYAWCSDCARTADAWAEYARANGDRCAPCYGYGDLGQAIAEWAHEHAQERRAA